MFVPVWVCGRILFFSYGCIFTAFKTVPAVLNNGLFTAQQTNILLWPGLFMIFMMVCLEGLQLFWTYYILSSFLATQITNKVKHTYD